MTFFKMHLYRKLLLLAIMSTAYAVPPSSNVSPPPSAETRVQDLLSHLTLDEKIDLIGGVDNFFIRAMPSIGLPRLKMSDGPEGVGTWGPSTAYAGGIALAASWDPELARRFGATVGNDALARGVNFILAPGVNIARSPLNGRNFEYLGEDPILAAYMAVGYIKGVQSLGVVATVKHLAGNNSETNRHEVSSDIDERTLHELYLPVFEAAVRDGHVGAVMDSYNRVNGVRATENTILNLGILKGAWGFDGILMSDWHATYDGIAAANAGLDIEMPSGRHMNRETLLPAIKAGKVSEATIDDKVRRILRIAVRFGFFDRPQTRLDLPLYNEESRAVALDQAREGIVLLRNRDNALPLDSARLKTVAVIGPNAWPAVPTGGGSAELETFEQKSFLTGIADFLGPKVRVLYSRGLPTPTEIMRRSVFDPDGDQPGIAVQSFKGPDFQGEPVSTSHLKVADQWSNDSSMPPVKDPVGLRLTARFTARKTGDYLIVVGAGGRDSYTLYLDGKVGVRQPRPEGQGLAYRVITLIQGQTVTLRLDYVQDTGQNRAGFGIIPMDEVVSEEAKKMGAMADAAIVCVGFDSDSESEAFDRPFELPGGQDALIKAIGAVNPKTIVTVTSGGGVDMRSWIERVPAVLQTWYAGQEGGTALAEILCGVRPPEGKLPVTFDRAWEENPVFGHHEPVIDSKTGIPHVAYAEGVFLGYRYYTTEKKSPLFPFGYGLSYTTFAFSKLKVPAQATSEGGVEVSFDVTNTGRRAGAEVAQLYIGDPSAQVRRPAKELKGFQKVRLEPGQTRRITLKLDRRSFAYWDATAHDWRVDPGVFKIYVGNSSTDTSLSADITLSR